MRVHKSLLVCFLVVACAAAKLDDHSNAIQPSSKFFPFFAVVRIENTKCLGENNLNGTCFARRECVSYGGINSGSCGSGFGVCCVIQRTCGSSTNLNCTYFMSPNYPSFYNGGTRCTITVNKCNDNICQLRLDFLDFSLTGPDASGICVNDFLTVTGGSSLVPRICGENTGQHVYVDFDEGTTPIQISIDTNAALALNRRWNIKISQIACDSPSRAPVGCLQYYTETSGTVKSFNFGTVQNPAEVGGFPGTRQLANLNYGVCVRMAAGYCSIEWTQDPGNEYSFTVSGDTEAGVIGEAWRGTLCTSDFIVIPNPSQNGVPVDADRFCGNALDPTRTSSKPFVLTVVTDALEFDNGDVGNRGFCLQYRQIPCSLFV